MKNYVIINGVNSLTITGLAISKLPSISKPPLRVMTEEINGRDGDLITELGYGAYDKELVIGLYGNYDINEVIGFFNQEGTIVFSNEDDKYYNFKIINQIDYEALIKFRTATISLHCQPFKYPLTETPEEITTEYVEEEGETLTLNDTKIAPLSIDLQGNTSQTGTPTPSSPINVNVVSGDNEVVVCGKNLFDKSTATYQVGYFSSNGTLNGGGSSTVITSYIPIQPNTQYYLSGNTLENVCYYDENKTFIERNTSNPRSINKNAYFIRCQFTTASFDLNTIMLEVGSTATPYEPYTSQNYPLYLGVENLFNGASVSTSNTTNWTVSFANNVLTIKHNNSYDTGTPTLDLGVLGAGTYILSGILDGAIALYLNGTYNKMLNNGTTFTTNATDSVKLQISVNANTTNTYTNVMLERGSKANSYTPYGTTPIELCKIGTYQDYIYKTDKWYLRKYIKKIVFNGTQTISLINTTSTNTTRVSYNGIANGSAGLSVGGAILCNRLIQNSNWNIDIEGIVYDSSNGTLWFRINKTTIGTTQNEVNTYLANNNLIAYFPLLTPEDIEITNSTLINQLEALRGAMSYEGQTNISQVNNDLPFILKVKGIKEGSGEGIINNIGNIYAKPIIALEGTGNIGIYKNGTQYFEVDMSSDNEITIDTEKMEAYHNGVLKNRKVIGDYNKFTIDEGNNNIEITGELTKATISNYTRWL